MIAVIAGTGTLPLEACKRLFEKKEPFFVIALFPEQSPDLVSYAQTQNITLIAQDGYKAGAIFTLLEQRKTTNVLFIGKVDKKLLFKHVSFDWYALKLLGSLVYKSDKDVMELLVNELKHRNIGVITQDAVLGSLLIKPGIITGTLTPELEHDIELGFSCARIIASAQIGQTVVVKDGMVLAVEGIEGTDACIQRGIQLGQGNVIVCKTACHGHNKAYDLPTLGPQTLAPFSKGDIRVLAWQSSHTLIAQKEEFIALAQALGIALVSKE